MAKRKAERSTSQDFVKSLLNKGMSRSQIGKALGRDSSLISQIEKGKKPGANLLSGLKELDSLKAKERREVVKGSRPVESKPSRRQAKAGGEAKVRKPSPLTAAKKELKGFSPDDKVVIYVNMKGVGKSVTLGSRGGISVDTIREGGNLGSFIGGQADTQGYEIDMDDVESIFFEEYY